MPIHVLDVLENQGRLPGFLGLYDIEQLDDVGAALEGLQNFDLTANLRRMSVVVQLFHDDQVVRSFIPS